MKGLDLLSFIIQRKQSQREECWYCGISNFPCKEILDFWIFFSKETDHYRVEKWNVSQSALSNACDPMDTHQPPLSMEFSRQEHWSVWPFSSPGDLPYLGIKPRSPALQVDSLPTELWGKPLEFLRKFQMSHPDPRPMEIGSEDLHAEICILQFSNSYVCTLEDKYYQTWLNSWPDL